MYCPECASEKEELFAAVKPFAEIFEKVRAAHEPRKDHERPDEMRSFLNQNECVPSGSNIGHWRKLADAFRRLVVNS